MSIGGKPCIAKPAEIESPNAIMAFILLKRKSPLRSYPGLNSRTFVAGGTVFGGAGQFHCGLGIGCPPTNTKIQAKNTNLIFSCDNFRSQRQGLMRVEQRVDRVGWK
jgi:hypothetical protein